LICQFDFMAATVVASGGLVSKPWLFDTVSGVAMAAVLGGNLRCRHASQARTIWHESLLQVISMPLVETSKAMAHEVNCGSGVFFSDLLGMRSHFSLGEPAIFWWT
jgi:hypothetical protein